MNQVPPGFQVFSSDDLTQHLGPHLSIDQLPEEKREAIILGLIPYDQAKNLIQHGQIRDSEITNIKTSSPNVIIALYRHGEGRFLVKARYMNGEMFPPI